jgi:hypothetical protein
VKMHEADGFENGRVHAFIVARAAARVEARRAFSPTLTRNTAKAGLSGRGFLHFAVA